MITIVQDESTLTAISKYKYISLIMGMKLLILSNTDKLIVKGGAILVEIE
ncbi:MAG: hypothetical protein ACK6DA_15040 [Candidatus Kapaibacterium sp.]|jgi:hypothetical protein